jgi:hypothetical protein
MSDKGNLTHKMHQLQKRVSRAIRNGGDQLSLKTILRINRIKKIKENLSKKTSKKG